MRSLVVIGLVMLLGCTQEAAGPDQTMLVLAAASTRDVAQQVVERFESKEGASVVLSTAASNALAQQILAGAPGQIFLSANSKWVDALEEQGLVLEREDLFSNTLVIVVPMGAAKNVLSPTDLASVDRLALAGSQVPAGIYAEEALRTADLYDQLIDRGAVIRGSDVRSTLVYVELGEVDAGIVYATDALVSEKVKVVYTFEESSHNDIVYELVLIAEAPPNPLAKRLFDFFLSPEATSIFRSSGFAVRQGTS